MHFDAETVDTMLERLSILRSKTLPHLTLLAKRN
jgi:hypothetical protein